MLVATSRFHVLTPATDAIIATRSSSVSLSARSKEGVVGMRCLTIRSKMDLLQTRLPDTAFDRLVSAKALVIASLQVASSTSGAGVTFVKNKSKSKSNVQDFIVL